MNRAWIALLLVGACNHADIARPSLKPTPTMYPVEITGPDTSPATRPPDVDAAKAVERAALTQIANHLPPDARDSFIADLLAVHSNTMRWIGSTSDPELARLLTTFYKARADSRTEQRRQRSVEGARGRPHRVTVIIGALPPGSVALVLRRRLVDPVDVIIL